MYFTADAHYGSHLNFSRVARRQMGAYLCIASNDVPPAVSKRVFLHVHCKYTDIDIDTNISYTTLVLIPHSTQMVSQTPLHTSHYLI